LVALNEALEIEGDHVPRSDERISRTLQAIADAYRASGDLEKAAEYYQKVTVYANMARRASDDLKATLDELERRRATLQAAKQSLALLDRSDNPNLKDVALIHALIAHSHARLNQPQDSADTIHTLLDTLAERHSDLSADDPNGDSRALAWLAAARRAEQAEDLETAQFACGSALESVRNADLRWLIEQTARAME
jgi:tetratricopeptide (TPR) repeat protein